MFFKVKKCSLDSTYPKIINKIEVPGPPLLLSSYNLTNGNVLAAEMAISYIGVS